MNSEKPIVLLVFANDPENPSRHLRYLPAERERIEAKLDKLHSSGLCEVVSRMNATSGFVVQAFQKYRNRVAVFHFGGHANGYSLLFESLAAVVESTDAKSLADFFGQQSGLILVFLNGCSTQEQVEQLLESGVSAVVATSRAIDDKIATEFAEGFYQSLASGASLSAAYSEAESCVTMRRPGKPRSIYFGKTVNASSISDDRFPWELYIRPGSEFVENWSLPDAANQPLFGLPELPKQDLPESPFRNLSWFEREHADLFFGRGEEIRELYTKVTSAISAPIILYYGQSGVGKSSLLDAGLLPRLESEYETIYVRRSQETGLLRQCLMKLDPGKACESLQVAWRVREENGKPILLVVDQIEEIFTRPNQTNQKELEEFIDAVHAVFHLRQDRPRGKLILVFRKEWLAEIESHLADSKLPRSKVYLDRLSRRGIIEGIQGPCRNARCADKYRLKIEDGLAEIIADDLLEDPGTAIAPTLQVLLSRMWKEANDRDDISPKFERELYQELRRQGILLDDFLRLQISRIEEELSDAVESGLLFDLLFRHTTPLGTGRACTLQTLEDKYCHRKEILATLRQICIEKYLLTVPPSKQPSASPETRLSHDTLAPVIRNLVANSEYPGQRARRCLESRIREWNVTKGSNEQAVLDEFALKLIEEGQNGTATWDEIESAFIRASQIALEARKPRRLTAEIFPDELDVKEFVPDELLIVRTADLSFQPLTYLESSGLRVVAYSALICVTGLGVFAQLALGLLSSAVLTFMARSNIHAATTADAWIFKLINAENSGWNQVSAIGLIFIALTGVNLLAAVCFYLKQPVRFDLKGHRAHTTSRRGNISSAIESLNYGVEEAEVENEIIAIDHLILVRRPLMDSKPRDDAFLKFYRSLCHAMNRSTMENFRIPPPRIYPTYPIIAFFFAILGYSFILGPLGILVGGVGLWRYKVGIDKKGWETSFVCLCVGLLTTPMLLFAWLTWGTAAKIWFFAMILPATFLCTWLFTILRAFGDSHSRKVKPRLESLLRLKTP